MNWIFYIIGTIICFTTLNILQRVIAVESKNPRASGFVFNVCAAFITVIIFLLSGAYHNFKLPTGISPYVFLGVGITFYGLFERFRFKAVQLLDASVLATIVNIGFIISFTGSLFVYNESLTVAKVIGVLFIFVALVLVTYEHQQKKIKKEGLFMGILISIFLGFAWMTDKKGAEFFNPDTYSIILWTLPLIFIYFPYIKKEDIRNAVLQGSWRIIFLAGLNAVGFLLQLKAFEVADATLVMPLIQLTTLSTVLMGIIVLKERDHVLKKMIGAILACIGAYFLV